MQIDASARVSKKLSLLVAGTALLLGGMALPSVCSAADTANPNEVGAKDIHNLMRPGNSGRAAIITFDQHGTGDVLLTLENEADPISSNDLGPDNIQK
jgi:ABC-type sulfate transport system substrate-binding protein